MSVLPERSTSSLALAGVRRRRTEQEWGRQRKGTLQRLYVELARIRPGSLSAYLLATVAVAVAVGLRLAFPYWLAGMPFSLLYLAVMAATFVCGAAAGAFSVGLATLVGWFLFISPQFPFEIHNAVDVSRLVGFVVVGAIQMLAVAVMRTAILRLRDLNKTLAAVYDEERQRGAAKLRDAIESISGGFLITDAEDRLVLFNQRVRDYFPDCTATLRPGAPYQDFLWERMQHGYYPQASGREEAWFAEAMARHHEANNEVESRLQDGRWLLVT
jgi:K+-sensing histidine kinase KdpD